MFIIIGNLRQKIVRTAKVLVLLVALGLAIPGVVSLFNSYAPVVSSWVQGRSREVGPMHTEPTKRTWFDKAVDQYVIKLQDFYYEERE